MNKQNKKIQTHKQIKQAYLNKTLKKYLMDDLPI